MVVGGGGVGRGSGEWGIAESRLFRCLPALFVSMSKSVLC